MKKPITLLLGVLCFVTLLQAQTISSYSIITTGSVLKGGANGNIVAGLGFENLRLSTTVEISAAAAQNLINFFPEKIAERDARIAVGNRMKQEADQKAQEMIQNTDRMRPDPSTFPQPESIPIVELPIPEEVE